MDIRTIPRSRHNPQYEQHALETSEIAAIAYIHMPALGGLRSTTKASPNTGWRNRSFRGYADYMQTAAFQTAMQTLSQLATATRCTLMCAEAVPWRCHRSLVADALIVRGIRVEDIMGENVSHAHKLTPWARVEGHSLTYPEQRDEGDLFSRPE